MQQQPEVRTSKTPSSKTIVLVEDHPIFSAIMKHTIEEYTAHRVIHIQDGSNLLAMLNEHRPHLLLLDYELPGLNGIELYDSIHSLPDWQHLPTIIVSADPPRQALAQRNLSGLNKPCRSTELVQAIEKALAPV